MREDIIQDTLKQLKVEPYHRDELARKIFQGACKTLAILLLVGHGEAITKAFKHDSLQRSCPDDKLPMTRAQLSEMYSDDSSTLLADEFFEKQWEFTTPIFCPTLLPRNLETQMILPFISKTPSGEGSFGTIWRIRVHADNYQLPWSNHEVSELLSGSFSTDDGIVVRC